MKNVGILAILIVATFGYTQAPDTLWTKTYGGGGDDVGYAILQTEDGGYLIVGSTESYGAGSADAYIIKTDPNGNTIWTQCYGGSEDDALYDIKPTLDDNYIVAGYTRSFGNGGADIWLLEIDSLGDTLRTGTFGGSGDDIAWSVEPTADSCYVVTGYVPMGFGPTVFLMKTAIYGGSFEWMQTYTQYPIESYGRRVIQTSDICYVVTADCHYIPGEYDYWVDIIKTDSIGNTVWTARPSFCFHDGHIVQVTDGYVIAGVTGPAISLYSEFCLSKIDADGDSLWDKIVYSHGDQWPSCRALQITYDGGFIIVGGIYYAYPPHPQEHDIILIRADINGDSLWNAIFGGGDDDYGYAVQQTADYGYIIAGSTESYGAGGSDVWIIKTEPDVGIEENEPSIITNIGITTTIFRGPLQLPKDRKCKVFDITGRAVEPNKLQPGIYFVEVDGVVTQKVVKVR